MKDPGGGRRSRLIPSFLGAILRLWNSIGNYPWRKWLRSQARFLSFLLPAAILLIVLVVYPVVATLSLSVVDPQGRFVGFQNYQRVIGSPETVNPGCLQNESPGLSSTI